MKALGWAGERGGVAWLVPLRWGVILIGGGPLLGCGQSSLASTETAAQSGRIRRDTAIVHEECATGGPDAIKRDANGDGRPDWIAVSRGGKTVCQSLDMNFDGRVDAWVYFDQQGQIRRRELDLDRDGRIDEIATYSGGRLVTKHLATNLAGRLDTWHYYEAGRLVRTERDADGDSVVDQWWEYPKGTVECAVVHSDVDGDGRPDPAATVDLCPVEAGALAALASEEGTAPRSPDAASERETADPSTGDPPEGDLQADDGEGQP